MPSRARSWVGRLVMSCPWKVTVPDRTGPYEIGCLEPGHYLAGMVGKIVIE